MVLNVQSLFGKSKNTLFPNLNNQSSSIDKEDITEYTRLDTVGGSVLHDYGNIKVPYDNVVIMCKYSFTGGESDTPGDVYFNIRIGSFTSSNIVISGASNTYSGKIDVYSLAGEKEYDINVYAVTEFTGDVLISDFKVTVYYLEGVEQN